MMTAENRDNCSNASSSDIDFSSIEKAVEIINVWKTTYENFASCNAPPSQFFGNYAAHAETYTEICRMLCQHKERVIELMEKNCENERRIKDLERIQRLFCSVFEPDDISGSDTPVPVADRARNPSVASCSNTPDVVFPIVIDITNGGVDPVSGEAHPNNSTAGVPENSSEDNQGQGQNQNAPIHQEMGEEESEINSSGSNLNTSTSTMYDPPEVLSPPSSSGEEKEQVEMEYTLLYFYCCGFCGMQLEGEDDLWKHLKLHVDVENSFTNGLTEGQSQIGNEVETPVLNAPLSSNNTEAVEGMESDDGYFCGQQIPQNKEFLEHTQSHGNPGNTMTSRPTSNAELAISQRVEPKTTFKTKCRRFFCIYCNKGFYWKNHLLNHVRIHTGSRPFRCLDCGRTFSQKSNLNTHKRFTCPVTHPKLK